LKNVIWKNRKSSIDSQQKCTWINNINYTQVLIKTTSIYWWIPWLVTEKSYSPLTFRFRIRHIEEDGHLLLQILISQHKKAKGAQEWRGYREWPFLGCIRRFEVVFILNGSTMILSEVCNDWIIKFNFNIQLHIHYQKKIKSTSKNQNSLYINSQEWQQYAYNTLKYKIRWAW